MSKIYDNWERLVAAVLKEEYHPYAEDHFEKAFSRLRDKQEIMSRSASLQPKPISRAMAASTKQKLLQILEGRIKWKLRPDLIHAHNKNTWNQSRLSAALGHLLEVSLKFRFYKPISTILWEDAKERMRGFASYSEMIASLTSEVRELFVAPKLNQQFSDITLNKNEVVAGFIDFLVQLLTHGISWVFPFEDSLNNLKEELRCLVVVLGDTDTSLFGAAEIEENLLAQFEAVANQAGSLVYSLFFAPDPIAGTTVGALFEQIELLKSNIIKFSNLPPSSSIIKTDIITPEAAAVDSFSIIVSLLRDLEELIMNRENDLIVNMKGQINSLHQGLKVSLSFLKDIKVLRPSDIDELKEVVMRIRDVAYESEYLINSFLVGYASLWYLNIRIPNVIHKIKLIEVGIQEIEKIYDIGVLKVAKDFSAQLSLHAKRNSDVGDIIVGLEDEIINILDRLTGGKKHLQIITIFGMPGLGKTTFAKKLYVHPTVNCYFDKLSWCIVSQAYQRKSVLIDILSSFESELGRDMIFNMEEENLAEHIYKSLKGRRYLIVMDDMWDSNVWDDLRRYFPNDRNGSRILLTSRNKDVAPPNSIIYELPTLSNGHCWELLRKKVFGIETCPPQLLHVGNQIAISCCGLPLAVIVVAGILWTMDREKSAWENVGRSLASYFFADKNNWMMQILELSYKHLPEHLKPCFLYFGAYQKGKEIPVRKLKRLWIAEGFICKHERKSLESVAEEYLMELIGKSLVIVTGKRSDGGVKNCIIHDLLHDLCLRRAEAENFLKLVDDNYSIYGKHQRLYAPWRSVSLNPIYKASHLLLGRYGRHVRSFIGYLLMSPLNVVSMELLRVLDCWNRNSVDLVGIETLVHLRYLAIHAMPTSIASFVNLECLVVHKRVSISSSLLKLAKLRHLQAGTAKFDEDCNSTQMVINNLEYLSNVCILNVKDEEMLKCSPHLRKLKCECKALLVDDEGTLSYRYPDLRFLTQLESLKMTANLERDAKAGKINFPSNIKKLSLSWLSLPWERMSIIGALPNLEILKLEDDAMEGEIWETRDGEFQQLRFLKLGRLCNFCKWDVSFSSEHFPKLQQLVLHDCRNLQAIPRAMGDIETLQLIEVDGCPESVGESAAQIEEEERDMGNEDLRIIIRNCRTMMEGLLKRGSNQSDQILDNQEMSQIYDNWERLVAAVLRMEELKRFAHSRSPSFSSRSSSCDSLLDFNFEDHSIGYNQQDRLAKFNFEEAFSTLQKDNQEIISRADEDVSARCSGVETSAAQKKKHRREALSKKSIDTVLHSKRYVEYCILFCSSFPSDYEFTKDMLVWQWIAEGLVRLGIYKISEEVCSHCFDTLLKLGYIVPSGYDYYFDQMKYKVGGSIDASIQKQLLEPEFGKYLDNKRKTKHQVERLSLAFKKIDDINIGILKNFSRLQTLIIHRCYGSKVKLLPSNLFLELKALKILTLSHTDITELPSSVENLVALRYFDVSQTPITYLSESIDYLSKLQTLKLDGCSSLSKLPRSTNKLVNLRHLILDEVRQLESMPAGIGKLVKLRTLRTFMVSEGNDCRIGELKNMNKLRGSIRILDLENVQTKEEAVEACLCDKHDLRKIELQWSDIQEEKNSCEEEILQCLRPPSGIYELQIVFYSGGVLPSWISDPSFSELVNITLYKCRFCDSLASFGELPSLKALTIIEMNELKEINSLFCRKQGNRHYQAFPKLVKLTFGSMSNLEKWTDLENGDFPHLCHVVIKYCPKFFGLPLLLHLCSLLEMEILYCPELSRLPEGGLPPQLECLMIKGCPKLKERCCNEQCEDWSKVAHVPDLYIDNRKMIFGLKERTFSDQILQRAARNESH